MNFDANTLSTLMQLLGAQKQQNNNQGNVSYASERDRCADNNDNYGNGYDNARSYNDFGNNYGGGYNQNQRNTSAQSVFAMQNGLGAKVDFFEKSDKKSPQNNSSSSIGSTSDSSNPNASSFNSSAANSMFGANPMSALLEMMMGKSSGGANTDMLSSLLPMLMNMMNSKQGQAQAAQASKSKEEPKQEESRQKESKDEDKCEQAESRKESTSDCEKQKNCNMKTQPYRNDKFEPIAFAGYTLISALNKLYMSKRFRYSN